MQIWNLLHAARWKHRTQKSRPKSQSGHHHTTLSGYIFATKARIDNRKKRVKQQYVLHMSPPYGELQPTSGWYRLTRLGHPSKFQMVSRLGSVTARHLVVGVSQTLGGALNRGRHLYSAGRPSRWTLTHISSFISFHDGTTPEIKKTRTVDWWRRLGYKIFENNFILTWNHGLRNSLKHYIDPCSKTRWSACC